MILSSHPKLGSQAPSTIRGGAGWLTTRVPDNRKPARESASAFAATPGMIGQITPPQITPVRG